MGIPQFDLNQAKGVLKRFGEDVRGAKNSQTDTEALELCMDVFRQYFDEKCREEGFPDMSCRLPLHELEHWPEFAIAILANEGDAIAPLPETPLLQSSLTGAGYLSFVKKIKSCMPRDALDLISKFDDHIRWIESLLPGR